MLERLKNLPHGADGVSAIGKVTKEDYRQVAAPLFEELASNGRHVRFLYHLGHKFEGFTLGGAWEDAKMGLRYFRVFDRLAIVTDVSWLRNLSRLAGTFMPCPVRVFSCKDLQAAISWLNPRAADRSLSYQLITEEGVLVVDPSQPLRAEDFVTLANTIDPFIESHGALNGLVVHARTFPGWENLSALLGHVRFAAAHKDKVLRIALVSDSNLAALMPKLAQHFVSAEVKHFSYEKIERAIEWAGDAEERALGGSIAPHRGHDIHHAQP